MSVFLDAWVDGRVGAHALCKWMSYHVCRSVGVSVFFRSLPTSHEKGVQVVWGASYERPGVCFVFSGDLGVWEGGGRCTHLV